MNKFKKFLKEHSDEIAIIGAGFLIGVSVAGAWYLQNLHKEDLRKAACYGFWGAIEWYDREVPDAKIKDVWLAWSKANPGKQVLS